MNSCDLVIKANFAFQETDSDFHVPTIPLLIHRGGMRRSISTNALIDTGFDEGLLLSPDVRDLLFVIGDPDREESLGAGSIEILCEVFLLNVKIVGKWYKLEGFAPREEGFETIIGRRVLNYLNVCIRGPQKEVMISE